MSNLIYKKIFLTSNNYKKGIARSFSRAALHYDNYATFQRFCGNYLCNMIGQIKGKWFLDAGCGTGWFSRYWQEQNNYLIALDLSATMLYYARKQKSASAYILGDIEQLPLATGSVDNVFSNLAVQWCDSLPKALAELYRVLRPGGTLALSTLALGSLAELEQAWAKIDNSIHINSFLSETLITEAFAPYKHRLLYKLYHLYYPCLIDLLRAIKGVGASYLKRHNKTQSLISRNQLLLLEDNWPRHTHGLPLSYHVVYGILYRE